MSLTKREFVSIGSIIVLGGILAACQPTPTLAPASAPGIVLGITDDICPGIEVQVGQQVTWTNQDKREHIVRDVSTEEGSLFDSGILGPGDSFSITFPQAGTYTYECTEDGDRTGTVTVQPQN
jgi:hypothetical protein